MQSFRRKILEKILRMMAKALIWRHRPSVIGITGSVGKSSTKEAIAAVLGEHFRIRASTGNFNNEIGLPLTILGSPGGGSSFFRWLSVPWVWMGAFLLPKSRYPEILVLEYGIDRIGDMDRLTAIVSPSIGVVTTIGLSHLEHFRSLRTVAREKGRLIATLPKEGVCILNADDPTVLRMGSRTKSRVLSFGLDEKAEVRGTHIAIFRDTFGAPAGTVFKLEYGGKSIPVRLPYVIAKHHVSAALAAAAVGISLGMNPLEVARALEGFRSLPGRMRLLEGVRRSLLIDDTYNASPKSLEAALETLYSLGGTRRIVALGDMLELGNEAESSHRAVAGWIRKANVAEVFLLGPLMGQAAEELLRLGFPRDRLRRFSDPETLGTALSVALREGDLVLIKGSQGMRMEKAVEAAMEWTNHAAKLLCRQSESWRRTPFVQPIKEEDRHPDTRIS